MKANKLIFNALEISDLMMSKADTEVCFCYFGGTFPSNIALEYGIIITPAMRKAYFYDRPNYGYGKKLHKVEFNLTDADDRKEFGRCIREIKRNLLK